MKLIVGLGNPGRKYQNTRHNVGYVVLQRLAKKYGTTSPTDKFQGELVEANVEGEKALLLCPTTYMNLSGASVLAARDFYKLPPADMLIVCDDLNLELGQLRIRGKGSSGGQNGLKDIAKRLASEEFPRLRIGIGAPPPRWQVSDYVLSKFRGKEEEEIAIVYEEAALAATDWALQGLEYCMNHHNTRKKSSS
jgi:PTH1 family peptidyl-tRNA hydrolase